MSKISDQKAQAGRLLENNSAYSLATRLLAVEKEKAIAEREYMRICDQVDKGVDRIKELEGEIEELRREVGQSNQAKPESEFTGPELVPGYPGVKADLPRSPAPAAWPDTYEAIGRTDEPSFPPAPAALPEALDQAARDFVEMFECVFSNDWTWSWEVISQLMTRDDHDFITADIGNWQNREGLISAYHKLSGVLESAPSPAEPDTEA